MTNLSWQVGLSNISRSTALILTSPTHCLHQQSSVHVQTPPPLFVPHLWGLSNLQHTQLIEPFKFNTYVTVLSCMSVFTEGVIVTDH